MEAGGAFYYLIYIIVILVVAVLIANTLLMSVFDRTREMGILASLGMKDRQVMMMVLLEAAILAIIGIVFGLVMGIGAVFYMSKVGFDIGEDTAGLVEGMALSSRMYPAMAPDQFADPFPDDVGHRGPGFHLSRLGRRAHGAGRGAARILMKLLEIRFWSSWLSPQRIE